MCHTQPVQPKHCGRRQNSEAVGHAASEVDGRSLLKVFGRTRHLTDGVVKEDNLRQHLIVEYEIV
jgi:hypothetical protein